MIPVQVGKVIYKDVEDQVRTVGIMREEKRVVISSEVGGKITNISAEEGMVVKANDVLAKIDPTDFQLEVERLKHVLDSATKDLEIAKSGQRTEIQDQLKAKENAAQSNLDLAAKNYDRIKALVKDGVMAKAELDTASNELEEAKENLNVSKANFKAASVARDEDIEKLSAQIEGIKAQYNQAQLDLSKTIIRSPFEGTIIKKRIDQGGFAGPNIPIVEMIKSPNVVAGMTLPQSYRNKLKKIEGIELAFKDTNKKIRLNKKISKKVHVIPLADKNSGTFKLWIDLPRQDSSLFAGLTFEAKLFLGKRRNVLHVPSVSLVISEKGTVVYIVKEGKAHLVPVRAFKERNGLVEVHDFTKQLNSKVDLVLRGSGAVFPQADVLVVNPSLPS
ncbi:MAG: biotin/lipoyl-binding protein [Nitrospinota bacterium]